MKLHIVGFEAEGLVIFIDSVAHLSLLVYQDFGQLAVEICIVGLETNRLLVFVYRAIKIPLV